MWSSAVAEQSASSLAASAKATYAAVKGEL